MTADICSDAFDFNTDINVRSITTKIISNGFSSKYSGYYRITITGITPRYASKGGTAELRWRLKNTCGNDKNVYGPKVIWSNPQITSMDGTGTIGSTVDYTRAYAHHNQPMEVFWQVGTTASYTLT